MYIYICMISFKSIFCCWNYIKLSSCWSYWSVHWFRWWLVAWWHQAIIQSPEPRWQITSKALKDIFHDSDITCMLWHLISLATWLFVQKFVKANKKIKVTHDMPLVSGIHQWPVDSPHRSTVMQKEFPLSIYFHLSCDQTVLKYFFLTNTIFSPMNMCW